MKFVKLIASAAILSILLFALVFAGQPNDSYNLQYKMAKGETLTYKQVSKTDILQEMMGAEQEMLVEVTAKVNVTSEGKDDAGNLETIVAYESFVADVFNPMMDSTFTDPAGIIGKRIRKVIAVTGDQIESVELDSFELGVLARGGFSSEREFLPNLPQGNIEVGETISSSDVDSTSSMGGTTVITSNMDYTLVGEEEKLGYDCVKIEGKGTVELEGDGSMRGMNLFIEGDGMISGTLYFAPKEGILVASEGTTDLEMIVAVTGQQSMTIPITQSTASSLTLQK